jgi:very-short-patch-repair endonuclease
MKRKAGVLRKNQTDAERLLWRHLRDRRLAGHKFRRQHPIGAFIADFVCIERRLVIELDGGQHVLQIEDDNRRSLYLKSKGYGVVRFWNDEVLKETQAVLEAILRIVESGTPSP